MLVAEGKKAKHIVFLTIEGFLRGSVGQNCPATLPKLFEI